MAVWPGWSFQCGPSISLSESSPGDIPRLSEASVDLRLLGFTFLVSVLTGIGFGLLPALQATRTNLNSSLKEGGTKHERRPPASPRSHALVVAEIALAQVLLVGAGLLIMSYVRLTQINPGFNRRQSADSEDRAFDQEVS